MRSKSAGRRGAVGEVKLPPLDEFTLSNGLSVTAARRGQLPLVALRLLVKCGSAQDPISRLGLADFTARLLRRGTRSLSADAVNDAVEFVGADLGVGVNEDFLVVRMTVPSDHLTSMLQIMGKVISEPAFAQSEVDFAKDRLLAQLANDLDDPGLVADRAIIRAVWGDHPYGHDVTGKVQHIQAFTRDDVLGFYNEHLGPKISSLIAVGLFDVEEFGREAERALGGWAGGPAAVPEVPTLDKPAQVGKVIVLDKPEQTQTQVRIGCLAIPRKHPDFMPAYVANTTLGGGFTSRLMDQIRVNRGLSYGVHSALEPMKAAGWFGIGTFTKTETTREIIDVALAEAKKMRERGLTQKELTQTQKYLAGLYPLRTESNEALASSLAETQLYGLGFDWIEGFRERVMSVSLAEAKRAAAKYFLPDDKVIVVLGNGKALRSQISGLGAPEPWKMDEIN